MADKVADKTAQQLQEAAQKKLQVFLDSENLQLLCQASLLSKNKSVLVIEDALDPYYKDKDVWQVVYSIGAVPKDDNV